MFHPSFTGPSHLLAAIESDFVEVVVFRRKGRIVSFLLLKRSTSEIPYPGIWQVVSGKRRKGESGPDTALREVREETGILPLGMWVLPRVNTFYSSADDRCHMVPTFAAEIRHDARVVLSDEHTDHAWVSRKRAEGLVQWPAHIEMMDMVRTYVLKPRGAVHRIPVKI